MKGELLAAAREQAERSSPPVRAAALLRIARVLTATDPAEARRTFELGLDEAKRLPGFDREFLLDQAASLLAAAVAPDLLVGIPVSGRGRFHNAPDRIARIMLDHDHGDAAFEYVMRYDEPSTFPYLMVPSLMEWFGDQERRLALFRRAIELWRSEPNDQFVWIFRAKWQELPPEEALAVVRELVRVTLEQPEQPMMATYDQEGSVQITSYRQHTFFELLHILRRLDPSLAESLIAGHDQLAAAARRFPNGMESVMEEAEARRKSQPPAEGGGYCFGGDPRDFPYMMTLIESSREGNFNAPLEHAWNRYREDTSSDHPNQAAREFWPSSCMFRTILYSAGKRLGDAAVDLLSGLPDDDIRLFAQIELAAALAGLPELQGIQSEYRPRPGTPDRLMRRVPNREGTPMPGIRCPNCQWVPTSTDLWSCKCGHAWNTFDTRGVCPECRFEWKTTACQQCGAMSPHDDWYEPR